MINDIMTLLWKESREVLEQGGRRGRYTPLIFLAVFGIFMPLQFGRDMIETPVVLLFFSWVPLFLVSSVVADSFAGERERHTLETLLASRLSDRAILLGKLFTAIGYGWGLTILSLMVGLVTVNVVYWSGAVLLYPAYIALGGVVLSLLAAGVAAGAGVLVSLRAATVRQAQQSISLGVMVLVFGPTLGLQFLPAAWQTRLAGWLSGANLTSVVLGVVGVLLVLNVVLFVVVSARFQRTTLILD
ncbi:MAG: ABC transporter permease subunit [Chloroflexota bacterium]|jgi:ABC-2 type transport system permease protein